MSNSSLQSFREFFRELPPFVKFIVLLTSLLCVLHLTLGDYRLAVLTLYHGILMYVAGEHVSPTVSRAVFSYVHERTGVPAYCGEPTPPSAGDWHRMIMAVLGSYVFIVGSTAALRQEISGAMMMDGVTFMLPWLGVFLVVYMIFETVHFWGHRREHRAEVKYRKDEETARRFWDQVNGRRSDPGTVA